MPTILLLVAALALPPKPVEHVTDRANALRFQDSAVIDARLAQFERQTSDQVLVYVDRDLPPGTTLEELAPQAMEQWGVGQRGKNNGVILFLFINPRQMRIQVGSGLRQSLTDSRAHEIMHDVMRPRLQAGDVNGAVVDGANAILSALRGQPYAVSGKSATTRSGFWDTVSRSLRRGPLSWLIFAVATVIAAVGSRFRRRDPYYNNDYYSNSSSSSTSSDSASGFESGGGSSEGSGGASDSW